MKDSLVPLLTKNVITLRAAFYTAHVMKNEVSMPEAYIITLLFERPSTKAELHERINRERSRQSHILRDMQDKGLIALHNDVFHLTKRGLEIYRKIVSLSTAYYNGALVR